MSSLLPFVLQNAGTTQQLNDVYGVGPGIVVAVGENGTILTWNGQRWLQRQSGIVASLRQVYSPTAPAGATSGFWVAANGALLYSGDGGGAVWSQNYPLAAAVAAAGGTSPPNLAGVWGSTPLDIWTVDNNTGKFWHTSNGGVGWTAVATAPAGGVNPAWGRMHGAAANFIVMGSTPAGTNSRFALYDGAVWNLFNTNASLGLGPVVAAMPFPGASGQFYTAGFAGPSPTAAQISNWPSNLATVPPMDKIPSGAAQQLLGIHGADLGDVYAVGIGFAGQGVALQLVPPAKLPGATGSWTGLALPAAMPAGALSGVYAGPSGYAVVVGAGGGIAMRAGFVLSLQQAIAVAANTVQVTLTNIPLAQSAIGSGDALNPASWAITRTDNNAVLTVLAVQAVSPTVYNLIIAERFGPVSVQHQITALIVDPFGNAIATPFQISFLGVIADATSSQSAIAAAQRYVVTDLANPQFPPPGSSSPGGTRVVTPAGDFAASSGNALLRKLIVRRLMTSTNGFFHLPGYGLGLDPKQPIRSSDMIALKKKIEQQILMEPEVVTVQLTQLELDDNGILTIAGTALTTAGQTVPFQTQVQGGSNS